MYVKKKTSKYSKNLKKFKIKYKKQKIISFHQIFRWTNSFGVIEKILFYFFLIIMTCGWLKSYIFIYNTSNLMKPLFFHMRIEEILRNYVTRTSPIPWNGQFHNPFDVIIKFIIRMSFYINPFYSVSNNIFFIFSFNELIYFSRLINLLFIYN